MYHAKGLTFSG